MQQAMLQLNHESQSAGDPPVYAGIAVNSGTVMAGSFGSSVYIQRIHRHRRHRKPGIPDGRI
jgi:hypothetical protein